ncbi:porin [Insolitispirillum peregrinum]|uniref:Outer membrane protein (Porin) n=1 Tax=Insolitispirillum peregrinum TaxID=80876 RepID=A0A1N7JZS8_9PROT|nr:porin [Insolitispirillum peregrinum]SIS54843.1 Outer membrane protein (porin) [Insolitispirillum peregrinum]
MKKTFAFAGALTAVATVMAVAPAFAADPIKLSVGGYGSVLVGYASQDDDFTKATGREVTGVDVKGDNEIHFKGSTTLDNGLTVAVKYEIEAGGRSVNNNDTVDSADTYSISVGGAFGTIVAAADGTALSAIAKGAPVVGGRLFNAGLDENDLTAGAYVLKPNSGNFSAVDATFINTSGDSESISYISPAIAGFTFGASYVPDVNGDDNPAQPSSLPAAAGSNEGYGVGLAWDGELSGVTIGVEGGYLWADAGPNTTSTANVNGAYNAGREEWQLGAQIGYAGFSFGGAYRDISQDRKAANGLTLAGQGLRDEVNGRAWEVGAAYKTGPYGVSLSYLDSSMENSERNVSDDSMKIWELAGEYTMGPGVALVAGVGHVDFENGVAAGSNSTVVNSNENSGWVVATGLSLTF